jgi:hypothetical protein
MRVVRQTSTRLTLRLVPWLLWLVGGIFTGVGSTVGVAVGGETVLRCDRTSPPAQCQLSSFNLLGHRRDQAFDIASLQGAEVQTSYNSDGDTTYRVVILTGQGPIPFTESYSSGLANYRQQASEINQFVQMPTTPSLHLHQSNAWFGLIFLIGFGGVGLAIVLFGGKVMTCDFDKSMGQLTLTQRGLLGAKTIQHPLHHLSGLRLEQSRGSKGGYTYRLALLLKSGETLPLTSYYDSGRRGKEKMAEQVCNFLGLPNLQTEHEDPINLAQLGNVMSMVVGGKGKRQETITDCQNQIRQDPYNDEAYYTLAMALVMQGEKDNARRILEAGRLRLMQNGDLDKAMRLNKAIEQFGLKV